MSPLQCFDDIRHLMIQRGWCPHQVRNLSDLLDSEDLEFLAEFDRTPYQTVTHGACVGEPRCVANNVDMLEYVTKHVEGGCRCEMIGPPPQTVQEIIATGGVPLISIRTDCQTGTLRLNVKTRTPRSRYIAISHVWSDGLGNIVDNSLPTCQIKRLERYIKDIPFAADNAPLSAGPLRIDWQRLNIQSGSASGDEVLFWMDTLCIPVSPEAAVLRARAINQMASVYAAAVQVLVLDAELQVIPARWREAAELLRHIIGANWMGRSWTFQEGALGRECVFQFADAAIDPIHAYCLSGSRFTYHTNASFPCSPSFQTHPIFQKLYMLLWCTLHQDWKSSLELDEWSGSGLSLPDFIIKSTWFQSNEFMKRWYLASRPSRKGGHDAAHFEHMTSDPFRVEQLVRTWNELARRSTTKSEDIHVIIANLLDFNADVIMRLGGKAERMRTILFSFRTLPFSLFYNTGPRDMQSYQYKNCWLPIEPSQSKMTPHPTMRFVERGLLLEQDADDTPGTIVFLIESVVSRTISFRIEEHGKENMIWVNTIQDKNESISPSEATMTCIVLEGDPFLSYGETRGALFHIVGVQRPHGSVQELRMVYKYPLQASWQASAMAVQDELLAPTYLSLRVPKSCRLVVEYDPIPNFNRLPRRPISLGPFQNGNILAQISLFCFILPAVGCLIAFGILKARSPHSWPAGTKPLLIIGVVLYAIVAVLAVLWYLITIPLAYRAWLRSFDRDWSEAGRSWWSWYVTADRGLANVEQRTWDWIWSRVSQPFKSSTSRLTR
ncbi:hypothetical protein NA57DRAFT_78777 [Rhizodiscina lignyota]|uniref:Heterokaryon incompatibility domain-containing protein n=1 Tax=Rhizodiscina lignyota TaxID=1504668 RepID=A0A9P4I6F0_9PEZI|nr:hypothetical protein NA57DRAFT_78777 [Rhizodiscina lignyota]